MAWRFIVFRENRNDPPAKPKPGESRQIRSWLVLALLAIHMVLLAYGAWVHAPTWDEPNHLQAGMYMWQTGRFDRNLGNPPLVNLLAAAPVVAAYPDFTMGNRRNVRAADVSFHRSSFCWIFTISRWACLPLSLLGGYVCYRWAHEMYGHAAGLLALWLWCFCPNLLAFGQQITGDMAAAALGVLAGYATWKWLTRPCWETAVLAGIMVGLAGLAKMIWIIWFVLVPLMWLLGCAFGPGARSWRQMGYRCGQLMSLLGCAVFTINVGYGFEGTFQPLGQYPRLAERVLGTEQPDLGGAVPIPLPEHYLRGIEDIDSVFERNHRSYLRGVWQEGGWWYYYLYGLVVKLPLGTLLLLAWACSMRLVAPFRQRWRDELAVLLPGLVVLVFVSWFSTMSHHFRYVLPFFPFAFVFAGKIAASGALGKLFPRILLASACLWTAASSLFIYPHSLSYFNELAGGPARGHRHMVDSSIDWGQDLLFLKRWMQRHPDVQPFHLAYFGSFDPQLVDIEYEVPPRGPLAAAEQPIAQDLGRLGPAPGWYAVSVNFLTGRESEMPDGQGGFQFVRRDHYTYFQHFEPVASAGYSIYIYHITEQQANDVRQQLGLPAWSGSESTGSLRRRADELTAHTHRASRS